MSNQIKLGDSVHLLSALNDKQWASSERSSFPASAVPQVLPELLLPAHRERERQTRKGVLECYLPTVRSQIATIVWNGNGVGGQLFYPEPTPASLSLVLIISRCNQLNTFILPHMRVTHTRSPR